MLAEMVAGGTVVTIVKYVLDRTPASLSMEYYQQVVTESTEVQQKAANSTRSFAVLAAGMWPQHVNHVFYHILIGYSGCLAVTQGPLTIA